MNIAKSGWEVKALVILAILFCIKFTQPVLFPLLISFFLYLLFNPIVECLEQIKLPKAVGSALLVLALLGVISSGISFLVQPAANWIEKAPENFRIIEQKFEVVKKSLGRINKVAEKAQEFTEENKKNEVKIAAPGLSIGSSLFDLTSNILILIFTIIIFLFFFLLYFKSFLQNLEKALFKGRKIIREKENDFLLCLKNEVSRYMLIFSLICAGLGGVMAFVFWLLSFPNALLWGVMVMLLTFIPYIGHLIGITTIVFISLISFDSYFYILAPPIIYFLCTVLEGQIITPIFLGNRLNLNPLMILFNIFIWNWLWGVSGVVISVPLLVTIKIALEHLPALSRYRLILEK